MRFEKVPPGQIRQKAMLDLSIEDGDVRDVGDRSDVLPALRRQQVGRAARPVPGRRRATDAAWFKYDDIFKAWRDAESSTANRTASPTTAK